MKSKTTIITLLAALTGLAVDSACAQGALGPSGAPAPTMKTLQQIEPRTPISSLPYIITNEGSYYLTGNLTGIPGTNGIIVLTNNVTIDLNGFTLSGVIGSGDGINAGNDGTLNWFGTTNFAVVNGIVQNWGANGIRVSRAYNSRFEQLHAKGNAHTGLYVGRNSVVSRCVSQNNGGSGLYSDGPGVLFESCSAYSNAWDGFYVSGSRAVNCISSDNGHYGFLIFNDSVLANSTARRNARSGITLGTASTALNNSVINNNLADISSDGGIRAYASSGRIDGNHITYSTRYGIVVEEDVTRVLVIRNTTVGVMANSHSIPAGNDVGPWGQAATATSPWANIRN